MNSLDFDPAVNIIRIKTKAILNILFVTTLTQNRNDTVNNLAD